MRAVLQRVSRARVVVEGTVVGELTAPGLLVYLGVTHEDGPEDVSWTARKIWGLRVLRGERALSDLAEAGEEAGVLVVSQFTLYGDARKGRRPTWAAAAPGPVSEPAYDAVCAELERLGALVERGVFGADMTVESVNDGPTTLILESPADG
ncbi:D-aminoacyl-tRNA deacylase [Marmoricola endophyticus]|uniref:D-aminoacyl-tRNA deacylase n=1 Tax=Marmoricola endophyticus TaxID=2040280 RepID=A0A917F7Y2_9ACTN|nr:D-aminoacyl-tRNA deacylase [Marmoricola endophyticus]GGF56688.1 D-aminoacyl-tRNA deacylase [Marmoricola endophyticus]